MISNECSVAIGLRGGVMNNFYIKELLSEECACGKEKKSGFSFCYRCYKSLPNVMRRDLYQRVHEGYEEAYDNALEYLGL